MCAVTCMLAKWSDHHTALRAVVLLTKRSSHFDEKGGSSPVTFQPSFRTPHHRRLAESVVEQLVAGVRRGEFSPGTRLPSERALVEMFGVSRTVIREALVYMQQAGIVHTRQGAGTFVASGIGVPPRGPSDADEDSDRTIGTAQTAGADGNRTGKAGTRGVTPTLPTDELRELFELRMAIEGEAAALAALRATAEDLDQLLAALQRFQAAEADARLGVDADFDFHRAIVQASHNRYFLHALTNVTDALVQSVFLSRIRSVAVVGRSELVQKEHSAVYEQIAAGNAVEARRAMRRHLDAACARLTGEELGGELLYETSGAETESGGAPERGT